MALILVTALLFLPPSPAQTSKNTSISMKFLEKSDSSPKNTSISTKFLEKSDNSPKNTSISTKPVEKSDKSPTTDEEDGIRRLRRAEAVLRRRIGQNLTVVLESAYNERNYEAVLRTCEALGIQHVWIVMAKKTRIQTPNNYYRSSYISRSAARYLTLRWFSDPTDCARELKAQNYEVWSTDLSEKADNLLGLLERLKKISSPADNSNSSSRPRERGFPERLAVVFGSEAAGVSPELASWADRKIQYPLYGFTDSLNLGVAAGIVLSTILQSRPMLIGTLYRQEEEADVVRTRWYQGLARTETQKELFPKYIKNPPTPLDDIRVPDRLRLPRFRPKPTPISILPTKNSSTKKLFPIPSLPSLNIKSRSISRALNFTKLPGVIAKVNETKEDRHVTQYDDTGRKIPRGWANVANRFEKEAYGPVIDIEDQKKKKILEGFSNGQVKLPTPPRQRKLNTKDLKIPPADSEMGEPKMRSLFAAFRETHKLEREKALVDSDDM